MSGHVVDQLEEFIAPLNNTMSGYASLDELLKYIRRLERNNVRLIRLLTERPTAFEDLIPDYEYEEKENNE